MINGFDFIVYSTLPTKPKTEFGFFISNTIEYKPEQYLLMTYNHNDEVWVHNILIKISLINHSTLSISLQIICKLTELLFCRANFINFPSIQLFCTANFTNFLWKYLTLFMKTQLNMYFVMPILRIFREIKGFFFVQQVSRIFCESDRLVSCSRSIVSWFKNRRKKINK